MVTQDLRRNLLRDIVSMMQSLTAFIFEGIWQPAVPVLLPVLERMVYPDTIKGLTALKLLSIQAADQMTNEELTAFGRKLAILMQASLALVPRDLRGFPVQLLDYVDELDVLDDSVLETANSKVLQKNQELWAGTRLRLSPPPLFPWKDICWKLGDQTIQGVSSKAMMVMFRQMSDACPDLLASDHINNQLMTSFTRDAKMHMLLGGLYILFGKPLAVRMGALLTLLHKGDLSEYLVMPATLEEQSVQKIKEAAEEKNLELVGLQVPLAIPYQLFEFVGKMPMSLKEGCPQYSLRDVQDFLSNLMQNLEQDEPQS